MNWRGTLKYAGALVAYAVAVRYVVAPLVEHFRPEWLR